MLTALAGIALLLTLKYFPGLENADAYSGNVFQAIYPDSFPGDPYIGPQRPMLEKPYQLSLMYMFPRLLGEIWLDDRFVAFFYWGLVLASVLGIDRIVRVAGVDDVYARLAVQFMFLRDHHTLTKDMTFAHQADIHYASFMIPVTIWLIYVVLARKPLWVVLALSVLLAGFSLKNAPYTIAYSLIIAFVFGGGRDRALVAAVFAAALGAFAYAVVYLLPVPEVNKVEIFDLLLRVGRFNDPNPFAPVPDGITALLRNAGFVMLCGAALVLPGPDNTALRGLRIFVGLGLIVWLLGGLYFTFAPDALKLPHVVPFSLVRNLRWPQTMAYVVIMICLFHWLRANEDIKRSLIAAIAVGVMVVMGPDNFILWGGLFLMALGTVAGLYLVHDRESGVTAMARQFPLVLFQVLALTMAVSYTYSISKRLPAWQVLAETGVLGDTGSATWIGVDDYFRYNTPGDAVVLPLFHDPRYPDKLRARRHLATRSGRTTPVFNEYSSIFDLEGYKREKEQTRLLKRIATLVVSSEFEEAGRLIGRLAPRPDYLILPAPIADAGGVPPFVEEARVSGYAILKWAE